MNFTGPENPRVGSSILSLARRPEIMTRVLSIVYRTIETHLIHAAGLTRSAARTGAVTLIQRFGGALNANIHFHMLFLDGVYRVDGENLVFRHIPPPTPKTLDQLVYTISQRVGGFLERRGLLVRDMQNSYLDLEDPDDSPMNDLLGHSITYRIAVGPQAGRKAFTLQTVPARNADDHRTALAKANGFSLHAGVAARAHQRKKLERLCRYIARPAVSTERLAITAKGNVRYTLKTPYRDGTTHIVLEPLDFIARLAALVPQPRVNLTRYHGGSLAGWRADGGSSSGTGVSAGTPGGSPACCRAWITLPVPMPLVPSLLAPNAHRPLSLLFQALPPS